MARTTEDGPSAMVWNGQTLAVARTYTHPLMETKVNELFQAATDTLYFRKLSENAYTPYRATPDSAGFDLCSAYDYVVNPRDRQRIETDLQIGIPQGAYGRIASRSGIALKDFVQVAGGVIDRDYKGSVGVILFNHSDKQYRVHRGDRIAQLIIEQTVQVNLQEATILAVFHPPTGGEGGQQRERGDGGFGSTGLN